MSARVCAVVAAIVLGGAAASAHAQWRYDGPRDPMTDRRVWHATVQSVNALQLGPPYQGGTSGRLTIRQREGEEEADILLRINRGQFTCSSYSCVVRVRFDDGEALDYGGSEPTDGSSDTIFIGSEGLFLDRIRQAKRVRIETTFFREGTRVFEFRTAGLRWPPTATAKGNP